MEETAEEDGNLFRLNQIPNGEPGYRWFLLVGFKLRDGIIPKIALTNGLRDVVKLLSATVPRFCLHPIKDDSYPILTMYEQVPRNSAGCFRYISLRNKNFNPSSPAMSTPSQSARSRPKSNKKWDDDADYEGPSIM